MTWHIDPVFGDEYWKDDPVPWPQKDVPNTKPTPPVEHIPEPPPRPSRPTQERP